MPRVGFLTHARLGTVTVNVRYGARNVSARWRKGSVHVTVPAGTTTQALERMLDDMSESILDAKPRIIYKIGQQFEFPDLKIEIRRGIERDKIRGIPATYLSIIEVGDNLDIEDEKVSRSVSNVMIGLARYHAPKVLIPCAKSVTDKIGRSPAAWKISNGRRTLGTCDMRGIISLSYMNMFLPTELREYVILHELAHLSAMNHSVNFHRILDNYLGGREKELVKALKRFEWPVYRY